MKIERELLTAVEAAALLKVKPATLYAYASRGFIQSVKDPRSGRSLYRMHDVQHLEMQKRAGHQPQKSVGGALDLGLPVLDSRLTLIEDGMAYYKGKPISELVHTHTLEDVARLLWDCGAADPFALGAARHVPPPSQYLPLFPPRLSPAERCMAALALTPMDESGSAWDAGTALLRVVTAAALQCKPGAQPIDRQCATAWRLDEHGRNCVRAALVLCADHELNISSFTARCAASSHATLKASVIAGMAALSGTRHGGYTDLIEDMWDDVAASKNIAGAVRRIITRNRISGREHMMPGFWHLLYPAGDPRCVALFSVWAPDKAARRIAREVSRQTGQSPSIDFALVALRRGLGLPRGAAFALFAIGRTVGWIAHALEQRSDDRRIRPRSRYVGLRPAPPKAAAPKNARMVKLT